tara:strand:+ start:385 stop:1464 length:1080 start_codon:yes stop_codon:yes gene_type:complete
MAINIQNHSKFLASTIIDTFVEDKPVAAGLSGFFPRVTTPTIYVDLEIERDNDLIAVDVKRYTAGNKNKFSIATEKKFQPPFYQEEYDFQRDEVYMTTIALGAGLNNASVNQAIAQRALTNVRRMRNKIERALRKQYAEVMMTGIVELKSGDSIDFKRKAASLVDLGAAKYWTAGTSDPIDDFTNGGQFLRDEGSSGATVLNAIMRSPALSALLKNTAVKTELDSRRIDRGNIGSPEFSTAEGLAFHGQISSGDYLVNLWTYNEKYTNDAGATVYYMDGNKVVLLPEDFRGRTAFAGLPDMAMREVGGVSTEMPSVTEAEFLLRAYSDTKTKSSTIELTSAPLAVPVTIDRIYTMQVLA